MVNNPQNWKLSKYNKQINTEFSYFTLDYNTLFTRLNTAYGGKNNQKNAALIQGLYERSV